MKLNQYLSLALILTSLALAPVYFKCSIVSLVLASLHQADAFRTRWTRNSKKKKINPCTDPSCRQEAFQTHLLQLSGLPLEWLYANLVSCFQGPIIGYQGSLSQSGRWLAYTSRLKKKKNRWNQVCLP